MAGSATFTLTLVDKVTQGAKPAKASVDQVNGALKKVVPEAKAGASASAVVGESMKEMVDDAMPASGALGKVTDALSKMGPKGQAVAAVLTVVVAVLTVVIGTFYKAAAAAVSISQEKDALVATFSALTGGAAGFDAVDASINRLANDLPQAKGQLETWAKSLLSAGIQGAELELDIRGIASASALMGATGGAAAEKMTKTLALGGEAAAGMMKQIQAGGRKSAVLLAEMGLQTADLAAALGVTPEKFKTMTISAEQMGEAMQKALITKGAGALETMGLTWDSIKGKLGDSFESLFEDMGGAVQPFMAEVKSLFSEFFEGSVIVDGAKSVLVSVLTKLFAVATVVVNAIHKGFLMIEIAALKVAIAIAPIVLWVQKLMNNATMLQGFAFILKVIAGAALAIAAPLILIGAATLVVIAAFVAASAAVYAALAFIVGAIAWCVGDAVRAFGVLGSTISGWASSAWAAAGNFISGLLGGIANGGGLVLDAVKNLASKVIGTFKTTLGIASPSRVMMQMGVHVAEGTAQGMDAGTDRVATAAEDMGGAAIGGAAGGMSGGRGRGGAGASVVFEKGSIVIDGAGKSALEITEEMLAMVFERLAASQGLMAAR
jgi:hypothetical protein